MEESKKAKMIARYEQLMKEADQRRSRITWSSFQEYWRRKQERLIQLRIEYGA